MLRVGAIAIKISTRAAQLDAALLSLHYVIMYLFFVIYGAEPANYRKNYALSIMLLLTTSPCCEYRLSRSISQLDIAQSLVQLCNFYNYFDMISGLL
jgi:hypothetical protein